MQGVVLAAGRGTRLRPLTDDRPKGLVDVGGKPLLDYPLETLVDAGVDELAVVVGYRSDDIRQHYGDRFRGVPITYTRQDEQLGLAHALLTTADIVADDFVRSSEDRL